MLWLKFERVYFFKKRKKIPLNLELEIKDIAL